MVEDVERLGTKFKPRTFTHRRKTEFLEQGHSARPGAWRPNIGQDFGCCTEGVISGSDRHVGICEVLVEIETGRSSQWSKQVWPRISKRWDARTSIQSQNDGLPRIETPDAIRLPPTHNGIQHWRHVAA